MIKLDNFRKEPRETTLKESKAYYDDILNFLSKTFNQEREHLDIVVAEVRCFTKLINLCLVAIDMDMNVVEVYYTIKNNLPADLHIVGEEEDSDEPKASVVRLGAHRGHQK